MPSKITKFGKKFGDILNIKKNFFYENDSFLKKQKKIAKLYKSQKKRKNVSCVIKIYLEKNLLIIV